jgi:hypothetical protein
MSQFTPDISPVQTVRSAASHLFFLLKPIAAYLLVGGFCAHADEIDFDRDVRTILSNHCFQCHGPDDGARKAGLRLDLRDSAVAERDGNIAIVPGNPAVSGIIQRITSGDPDQIMPPPEFQKPLSPDQIDKLTKWVQSGAEYKQHWSFEPIVSQAPPVSRLDEIGRNGVDHFVLQKLARHNISLSMPADKYTLIRRVYLDLLGLPPAVEEVDRFVADKSDTAYESLLDRVLASPHFGERWGRHWLDQARYADSHGYTNDNERSIWPYRDWVIQAFNSDMPFDQFTIEQLAGDLLPNPTLAQRVATGFHRNTLINTEGGTKADQFRDEQVKDRVDTTGLVWLGLTVGCAKCHTHKFDPITQHEYYQLYAFFNSTADSNSETPTLKVPSSEQTQRVEELTAELKTLKQKIAEDFGRQQRQQLWEQEIVAHAGEQTEQKPDPDAGWTVLELSGKSLVSSILTSLDDRSLLVSGQSGMTDEYQSTTYSPLTRIRSVRLEVLTHDSLPKNGPGRADTGNFLLSEFWFRTGDGRELRFHVAGAEHSQRDHSVSLAIDGRNETGWAIDGAPEGSLNRNRTAWFVLPTVLEIEPTNALTFQMQFLKEDTAIGRFRISVSEEEWQDNPDRSILVSLVALREQDRTPEQQQRLDAAFLKQDSILGPLQSALAKATQELEDVQRAIPSTMVLEELEPRRTTHLQIRGDFLRTGDEVRESVPAVLPQLSEPAAPKTRLDFAKWLMRTDHPLTARVRANRIWMHLFGRGLVETDDDFGIQGTPPSHPELLDWLASEFQRSGWSQKQLIKLIMTSATYRQSSIIRPELIAKDPQNLLLARQNRIRMEAEIIRDFALAVSGKLSPVVGGPSVFPPQEDGVYAFTQRPKNWKTSVGDDRYRRGMYTFFYRSAPYPMFETFDVPKFNATCTRRDRSDTPLQSLTMSNSSALYELAGEFGKRIAASEVKDDEQRLAIAFRECFARPLTEPERAALIAYLRQSRDRFPEEQSWIAVARLLINLDEFITRE